MIGSLPADIRCPPVYPWGYMLNDMCYPVTCPRCGKTTWDGCGEHVAEVKASVPPEQWCTCREKTT